ncbi:MAG: xanthine dehydrogenase family protein subunit M [Candidatus Aminicenantes bacterium]|nr:MAG: xanthine dehydrogenase family protein subunit M [Candidatus Aminicenantes bacterium]
MAEAFKLLEKLREARILAGGTDLLVDIKQGLVKAEDILSLLKIKELRGIEREENRIKIGAIVTAQEIISDPYVNQFIPALADAANSMASPQIRSMATIGGNISSAVPSADLPPTLIAAESKVELQCSESSRQVSLSDFFQAPRETICNKGELLTSIFIPLPPPRTGIAYEKFSLREANSLAVAAVSSRITLEDRKIEKALIVLGAVAPTPLIALKASESLLGREPSDGLFKKASLVAKEEGEPISDVRGSAWHRKELIQILTQRSLTKALKQTQEKSREDT